MYFHVHFSLPLSHLDVKLVLAEAATFPSFCLSFGYIQVSKGTRFLPVPHFALILNDEFTFTAFRNHKQLSHSVGHPLLINTNQFSEHILEECILPEVLNLGTQPNIVVLTALWPQTFFHSVCISSSFSLILHCCCSAERIWNIYQGIVCWRHNFHMVMLLAFQITFLQL